MKTNMTLLFFRSPLTILNIPVLEILFQYSFFGCYSFGCKNNLENRGIPLVGTEQQERVLCCIRFTIDVRCP